jgi:multidrug efflux pump subunit AcrB
MSFLLGALSHCFRLNCFLTGTAIQLHLKSTDYSFSIFLSFTGVLYGISVFGMPFVIMMTMMGIISLSGIVVNNGVVLIDYTQLLIARKKEELGHSL